MIEPKDESKGKSKKSKSKNQEPAENEHLGSSNAFEETENPFSKEAEDISDEKLDEILGD